MANAEQLKALFRAFVERRDTAFLKVADTIIAEELAANHHALANEARSAIAYQDGRTKWRKL
jgi:hypothetical protein